MAINFPVSLDTLSNPTGSDLLENATAALDHDVQHSNANDAIEALEAKVGANSSAVTTSHDYKLSGVTGSDKAVSKTGTETLTNKTLTAPQINMGSDANGDLLYRNGSGVTSRLAIGSTDQILAVQAGLPAWIANPSATAASATVAGIVELATTAETETGTDATRAVTPDGLHDMTTLAGAAWFLDEDTMSSDSATKTASQQSIKAYTDSKVPGFGTWGNANADGSAYQVTKDSLLIVTNADSGSISVLSDAANPPTVQRARITPGASGVYGTVTVPIRKNDYYKITGSAPFAFLISVGA
ncbi:hypothetical protein K9M47_03080 [Candidatus Gracilibacteria bacterium]|nr:hypothetical protein [Candidatus Gracilibacteria bacterium]